MAFNISSAFSELRIEVIRKCVNNSQSVGCATSPAEWSLFLWGIGSLHSLVPTSPVSRTEKEGGGVKWCYCISIMKSAPLSKTSAPQMIRFPKTDLKEAPKLVLSNGEVLQFLFQFSSTDWEKIMHSKTNIFITFMLWVIANVFFTFSMRSRHSALSIQSIASHWTPSLWRVQQNIYARKKKKVIFKFTLPFPFP